MRWRIYYGDGSTYSDRDGLPELAPNTNAQVVAREFPNNAKGYALMHSKDAFVWREGRWDGVDTMGLWDYIIEHQGWQKIILGRSIRDDTFWKCVSRAGKEGLG